MIIASYSDKQTVVDILSAAFVANKSVDFVVKQDKKRAQRIHYLMDYSFEVCWNWGEVFLSDDKTAAALAVLPHSKKTNLKAIQLDAKLALKTIGVFNVIKVLKRESYLEKQHPTKPFYYLWFLGVIPAYQGNGSFEELKNGIFKRADQQQMPICIETSGEKQKKAYIRYGFELYHTARIAKSNFDTYFLKRDPILVK